MENIYTVKETAKILGFSTNTLYKYLEEGTIEAARGGGKQGRFRIPHSSIESYLGTELSDEHIQKALTPQKLQPLLEESSATPVTKTFPITTSRILIIASLLILIVDLIINNDFSLTNQLIRMSLIVILVLLAYQFGGYEKVEPPQNQDSNN